MYNNPELYDGRQLYNNIELYHNRQLYHVQELYQDFGEKGDDPGLTILIRAYFKCVNRHHLILNIKLWKNVKYRYVYVGGGRYIYIYIYIYMYIPSGPGLIPFLHGTAVIQNYAIIRNHPTIQNHTTNHPIIEKQPANREPQHNPETAQSRCTPQYRNITQSSGTPQYQNSHTDTIWRLGVP